MFTREERIGLSESTSFYHFYLDGGAATLMVARGRTGELVYSVSYCCPRDSFDRRKGVANCKPRLSNYTRGFHVNAAYAGHCADTLPREFTKGNPDKNIAPRLKPLHYMDALELLLKAMRDGDPPAWVKTGYHAIMPWNEYAGQRFNKKPNVTSQHDGEMAEAV